MAENKLKYLDLEGLTSVVDKLKGVMDTKDTAVKTALTTEIDKCFGYVKYDSAARTITFYHTDGASVLGTIETDDFVKDGMVENVEVKDGKLVITFNTDSDRTSPIEIELTEIFEPNNYYTKTEVEGKINDLKTEIETKLEDYYTSEEVDAIKEEIEGSIEELEGSIDEVSTALDDYKEEVTETLKSYVKWEDVSTISTAEIEGLF